MSYATSLLMAYPPPYGPSTLLSDDLVQRPTLGGYYEPSSPYMSGGRLLSDHLTHNQIGLGPTNYRSSAYSQYPSTNYRPLTITDWRRDVPPQNSYTSINNIREYSESLGTTSNTNTASSIAHSINDNNINGSMTTFPNYQQSYNRLLNDADRSPHLTTLWSPSHQNIPTNNEKPTSTHRSLPGLSAIIVQKKSPVQQLKKDTTPVPSPSPPPPPVLLTQENNLHRNPTLIEIEKQPPSVDIQTWLSETKEETPVDEKTPEQAWTVKVDHLHMVQAQREKEKAKSSRALPSLTKKVDQQPKKNKSTTANDNKIRDTSFQMRNDSYFDSLFDGNFVRKSSVNQQSLNSSSNQRSLSIRNKPTTNSFDKPKTSIFPKYVSPRRVSQYEPPSINRAPPTNNNTSWKKQWPKSNQPDSTTPRENIHKDSDERFREALQKVRVDRAEQQQKELTVSTAKRLNYGDYVRRSTKDTLMHNVIRPLPWSDFMDVKKGNLYNLTKEEKKDLYNQSRSYGERVRNRNFALHQDAETARTLRRMIPIPAPNQDPQSSDETSHEPVNNDDNDDDDDSKSLKRPDSGSTVKTTTKTYTKQKDNSDTIFHPIGRTTMLTDQSSTIRPSEEEDEDVSDFESSRKQKTKSHYSRYDSSVQTTTTATEESETDETSEQQSTRIKNRDSDDDLFTVREEKTMESLEGARYKKR